MREIVRRAIQLSPRPTRWRWGLLVLVGLGGAAIEAGTALVIASLVQGLTGSGGSLPHLDRVTTLVPGMENLDPVTAAASTAAIFFAVRAFFVMVQTYLQQRIPNNIGARIARELFLNYLRSDYAVRLGRDSPELIRNITSIPVIVSYVFYPLVALASELLVFVGLLVAVLIVAPVPGLAAGIFLGVLAFGIDRAVRAWTETLGERGERARHLALRVLTQGLTALREVKVFRRERDFAREYEKHRWAQAKIEYTHATLNTLPRVLLETILFLGIAAFAVLTRDEGSDSFALLGLLGYVALRALPGLGRIVTYIGLVRFGTAAVNNIYDDVILEREKPDVPDKKAPRRVPLQSGLMLRDVSYTYPGSEVPSVSGVNLHVKRGESVGIVGPSGAGKTTLMDIMLGLLKPEEGQVSVEGCPLHDIVASWHETIAIVSQDFVLFDASLKENITMLQDSNAIDPDLLTEAVRAARLTDVVRDLPLGIDTEVGERGVRLSGGQRQRIAIARAVYRQPDVLFLDEGTSALDTRTEADVMKGIQGGTSRTLIMIAHRINTVRACDRIVFLEEGRIRAIGSYDDLIRNDPSFRELAAATEQSRRGEGQSTNAQ